jgi:V/A-type H+-transporting ATPase subunit D
MENTLFPTKGNLITAKNTLSLSKLGFDLMDKKRNILVREMINLMDEARYLQSHISTTFAEAYFALQNANLTIGITNIKDIADAVEEETDIEIKVRSLMGVEMPMIKKLTDTIQPRYGFVRTNVSLDEAYTKFEEVKKLIVILAEVENAIYRLAHNVKRTQKRANALQNIMIPKYETIVSHITNALEEKEREEFTRLKMIKSFKESS